MKLIHSLLKRLSKTQPKHIKSGAYGEQLACKYLKKEYSFKILEKNWKHHPGEIDIIAKEGPCLVFVEVKTRSEDAQTPGYYAVTAKKKKILQKTAQAYMRLLRQRPRHYRFDVVEVRLGEAAKYDIHYYKNVSLFSQ